MTDLSNILEPRHSNTQDDHGETNVWLLAREIKANFRRVESASRKIRLTLQSPEGRRLFLRFFDAASLNMHFVAVIAPINLPVAEVDAVVIRLEQLVEKGTASLNEALVQTEQLCHRNGISDLATYDVEPLIIDARVHSRFGRRYLELITKIDQLMQILETLVIDEVMLNSEMAARKARAKRAVRAVGSAIRLTRFGLHKRINALARKGDSNRAADVAQEPAFDDRQGEPAVIATTGATIDAGEPLLDEPAPQELAGAK